MQLARSYYPLLFLQYALSPDLPGYIIMHFDGLFKTARFNSSNLIDFKKDIHIIFESLNEWFKANLSMLTRQIMYTLQLKEICQ